MRKIILFLTALLLACTVSCAQTSDFQYTSENTNGYSISPQSNLRDIVYKTNLSGDLHMDVFPPKQNLYDKSPCVFAFHGGGWIAGNKSQIIYEFGSFVEALRQSGITVVAVQYTLANEGNNTFPAQIEDCLDAVAYITDNADTYGIDTGAYGVMGYSAGAQLALLTAYSGDTFGKSADMKCAVSFAAPVKFYDEQISDYSNNTLYFLEELIGGGYADNTFEYEKASPFTYFDESDTTPALLIQGDSDNLVPPSQGQLAYDRLTELGIPAQLQTVQNCTHSFTPYNTDSPVTPDFDQLCALAAKFISDNIKG